MHVADACLHWGAVLVSGERSTRRVLSAQQFSRSTSIRAVFFCALEVALARAGAPLQKQGSARTQQRSRKIFLTGVLQHQLVDCGSAEHRPRESARARVGTPEHCTRSRGDIVAACGCPWGQEVLAVELAAFFAGHVPIQGLRSWGWAPIHGQVQFSLGSMVALDVPPVCLNPAPRA